MTNKAIFCALIIASALIWGRNIPNVSDKPERVYSHLKKQRDVLQLGSFNPFRDTTLRFIFDDDLSDVEGVETSCSCLKVAVANVETKTLDLIIKASPKATNGQKLSSDLLLKTKTQTLVLTCIGEFNSPLLNIPDIVLLKGNIKEGWCKEIPIASAGNFSAASASDLINVTIREKNGLKVLTLIPSNIWLREPSSFNSEITLTSSDWQYPKRFIFELTVPLRAAISKEKVNLGIVKQGAGCEFEVLLSNSFLGSSYKIQEIKFAGGICKIKELEKGSFCCSTSFNPKGEGGTLFQEKLVIKTNDELEPVIVVPVYCIIQAKNCCGG